MSANPLVSVICPVHNRSTAIAATIRSVIGQDLADWELLIVLDGCTDDTAPVVGALAATERRIRVLTTPGFGHPSEPRNLGLRAARGELIAYLDHDDRWAPGHLRAVVGLLAGGADLVATGCRRLDESGALVDTSDRVTQCWHPELQLLSPLFEPSRTAHRAGVVAGVGGWRSGPGLEDWDLWVRLADAGIGFRTTTEQTVTIGIRRGSRRFATRRPHRIDLARFDAAHRADAAVVQLRQPQARAAVVGAATADAIAWYERLRRSSQWVEPVGPAAPRDPGAWRRELSAAVRRSAANWTGDLMVRPVGGEYRMGLASWASTPELAGRVARLSRRVLIRQVALVHQVAAAHGGRPLPAPTGRPVAGAEIR